MHVPINVKSPNNISEWQMGFNSAFKGLKHLKFAPTGFGPFLKPSSGGSWTVLYAVTKLRSVDVRLL